MLCWFFMIIAIVTEVIGTLAMKHSLSGNAGLWMGLMYVMLIISYSSLAVAVKQIPIAVAYGTWESLGLILITLFSFILFHEPLSFPKILAIIFIIAGILLLETGTYHDEGEADHDA